MDVTQEVSRFYDKIVRLQEKSGPGIAHGRDYKGQLSAVTLDDIFQLLTVAGVTSSSNVLDLGSGTGSVAVHVAKHFGCSVTGIDISKNGVENGRKLAAEANLSNVQYFQGNLADLPAVRKTLGTSKFDVAYSIDVLCHVPARNAIFTHLFPHILKSNARIAIIDHTRKTTPANSDTIHRAMCKEMAFTFPLNTWEDYYSNVKSLPQYSLEYYKATPLRVASFYKAMVSNGRKSYQALHFAPEKIARLLSAVEACVAASKTGDLSQSEFVLSYTTRTPKL
eukprot:TRINITY_DN16543_c0_g1_i1.p1 TRINITY_DN16543_c0_g1~~TRINITY_DN16543_c0_g1_i1.p1  ORF type:complete len:280 (+),score=35.17 TRINITY_DN16543_c0_g1_i1:31-870(+)